MSHLIVKVKTSKKFSADLSKWRIQAGATNGALSQIGAGREVPVEPNLPREGKLVVPSLVVPVVGPARLQLRN